MLWGGDHHHHHQASAHIPSNEEVNIEDSGSTSRRGYTDSQTVSGTNVASRVKSSNINVANGISKQGVKYSDLAANRGKGSIKKQIGKGSIVRSRGLFNMSNDIRKYFVHTKYDNAADVLRIERESD